MERDAVDAQDLGRSLDEIERAYILRTLDECNGNRAAPGVPAA